MEYKQVKLPQGYFLKRVIRDYYSWKAALIREFIQNSFDAKSTRIAFKFDGEVLMCRDDGIGMDWKTMETALLTLGGSKKQEATVGGLGVAKEILYFAWPNWSIETGRISVVGKEGQYKRIKTSKNVKGVRSKIEIKSMIPNIEDQIKQYVRHSNINTRITFNGTTFKGSFAMPGKKIYEIDGLGSLYMNRIQAKGRDHIIVQAHGLYMFSVATLLDKSYIFDITMPSYDCLTGNRDGFVGDWQDKFQEMVGKVTIDSESTSIKREEILVVSHRKGEDRRFLTLDEIRDTVTGQAIADFVGKPVDQITEEDIADYLGGYAVIEHLLNRETNQRLRSQQSHLKTTKTIERTLAWYRKHFDEGFIVVSEKIINSKLMNNLNLRDSLKLVVLWRDVVRDVAKIAKWNMTNCGYGVIISGDTEAQYRNGYFLINPFIFDETIETWDETVIKFILLACHEVVHATGTTYHNERFDHKLEDYLYTILSQLGVYSDKYLSNIKKVRK